jgi:hypothetical protein
MSSRAKVDRHRCPHQGRGSLRARSPRCVLTTCSSCSGQGSRGTAAGTEWRSMPALGASGLASSPGAPPPDRPSARGQPRSGWRRPMRLHTQRVGGADDIDVWEGVDVEIDEDWMGLPWPSADGQAERPDRHLSGHGMNGREGLSRAVILADLHESQHETTQSRPREVSAVLARHLRTRLLVSAVARRSIRVQDRNTAHDHVAPRSVRRNRVLVTQRQRLPRYRTHQSTLEELVADWKHLTAARHTGGPPAAA